MANDLIDLSNRLLESLLLSTCPNDRPTKPADLTVDECMKRGECGCDCGVAVEAYRARIRNADAQADHDTERREGWDY